MDHGSFDRIARLLGNAGSRRAVLGALLGGGLLGSTEALARKGNKRRSGKRGRGRVAAQQVPANCFSSGNCTPGPGKNLSKCDYGDSATLAGKNVKGSNLTNASLVGADATGADLRGQPGQGPPDQRRPGRGQDRRLDEFRHRRLLRHGHAGRLRQRPRLRPAHPLLRGLHPARFRVHRRPRPLLRRRGLPGRDVRLRLPQRRRLPVRIGLLRRRLPGRGVLYPRPGVWTPA
jgi:hypothetical protein